MDFNFPLILMVATLFTGVVAALDKFWLAQRRAAKTAALKDAQAPEAEVLSAGKESMLVEQSKSFFPVLLIVFLLRSFVAEPFQIPSGSMEPGLVKGDFIVVSKFSYGLRMPVFDFTLIPIGEPQRGDVMVFFPPDDPRYFIKRVIGLPGDHVVYRNKQLTINGEVVKLDGHLEQPNPAFKRVAYEQLGEHKVTVQWLSGVSKTTGEPMLWGGPEGEWTVPDGHYFMMGDNRGNSADSRVWGFVPERNIVGKAQAVWMHWENFTDIPSLRRNGWID